MTERVHLSVSRDVLDLSKGSQLRNTVGRQFDHRRVKVSEMASDMNTVTVEKRVKLSTRVAVELKDYSDEISAARALV